MSRRCFGTIQRDRRVLYPNREIFLMSRDSCAMLWRPRAVTDWDSDHQILRQQNPARTLKEMVNRSAVGKPRGHTTQRRPKQHRGVRREGRWDSNTPMVPLLLAAGAMPLGDRFTTTG